MVLLLNASSIVAVQELGNPVEAIIEYTSAHVTVDDLISLWVKENSVEAALQPPATHYGVSLPHHCRRARTSPYYTDCSEGKS